MGFYQDQILPKVTDWVCRQSAARKQREKIVPQAKGRVLEIGFGSGLNLEFYRADQVSRLWGLEPSQGMLKLAEERKEAAPFEVELLQSGAEAIPLEDHSVDTVLSTFTLCTVPDLEAAFAEMRRVLKPGGQLLFCEHGLAPDPSVRRWQNSIQPVWKICAGGCHLNRDIPELIQKGGFQIQALDSMYIPGWKPASFQCWGQGKLP